MKKQLPFESVKVWQNAGEFIRSENSDPLLNAAYDLSVRINTLRESQLRRAGEP